jgi:hypothetical protein
LELFVNIEIQIHIVAASLIELGRAGLSLSALFWLDLLGAIQFFEEIILVLGVLLLLLGSVIR